MTTTDESLPRHTPTALPSDTRNTHVASGTRRTRARVLRLALHYLEMVLAMTVGMMVLGPLRHLALPALESRPDVAVLAMATDMAVGMGAWMLVRRSPRAHVLRMTGAMYLGFVLVLPAYWVGALSASAMAGLGHVLMLVLMLVVMVRPSRRRSDAS